MSDAGSPGLPQLSPTLAPVQLKDASESAPARPGGSEEAAALPSPRTAQHLQPQPAARSPRRGFKCQPCRKPARGGSPRVLAKLARPCGPGGEKLSRAPPCLWAVAPLGTRDRSLHGKGGMHARWERSGISFPASGGLIWEQRPLRDSCEDRVDLLHTLPALKYRLSFSY